MMLKSRKAELKQKVKVSLAKYVEMLQHDSSYNIRIIFTNTQLHIFRISKNQNISNNPTRCLNFSFFVKELSNLNCLQGRVGKSW